MAARGILWATHETNYHTKSFIDIRLERGDDAQLIFESLNSTGLDLSEADKVHNYLLMSMPLQEQERCYELYWHKIETYTEFSPTMFIRDYLTLHTRNITILNQLYFDFQKFVQTSALSREAVLRDMAMYAKHYHTFYHANTTDAKLNRKIRQISTIGSTVGLAFYLAFFAYAQEQAIPTHQIIEVLDVIENYLARRIICNFPTHAKIFATLHHDVTRHMQEAQHSHVSYIEVLKYSLLKRQGAVERHTEQT